VTFIERSFDAKSAGPSLTWTLTVFFF
jgi:hypothetical protein